MINTRTRIRDNDKGGHKRAFTLIEIIVSLGIFSIVVVVALGALVKIIDANRKAQTLQSAMTNLNFALESMSRELRVGSVYNCLNGDSFGQTQLLSSTPCNGITGNGGVDAVFAFNSSQVDDTTYPGNPCNLIIVYRFKWYTDHYELQKARQKSCDYNINDIDPHTDPNSDFAAVTDPNAVITGFYMQVTGDAYPLAVLRVSGYSGVRESEVTIFDVQTAISARLP